MKGRPEGRPFSSCGPGLCSAEKGEDMNFRFGMAVLALALLAVASSAQAARMKVVNGQAYWDEDPGPIDPGSFWTSGQYKYDPDGYLERNARDPDQYHEMTVYADHSGKARCVFRQRVANTDWEFRHAYLRVCRR
jgi:hypothetical protein